MYKLTETEVLIQPSEYIDEGKFSYHATKLKDGINVDFAFEKLAKVIIEKMKDENATLKIEKSASALSRASLLLKSKEQRKA